MFAEKKKSAEVLLTIEAPPEGQPYEVKAGKILNEGKGQKVLQHLKKEMKKAMQQHQRRRSRGKEDGLPYKNCSIKEYMYGLQQAPIKGSTVVKQNQDKTLVKSPSIPPIYPGKPTPFDNAQFFKPETDLLII